MIIAIGESVLTTGVAIADAPIEPMTVLTGTVALTCTVALFWLYFGCVVTVRAPAYLSGIVAAAIVVGLAVHDSRARRRKAQAGPAG